MKVTGVDHISINVKDLETSVAFYKEVLGFRRLQTVPMDDDLSLTFLEVPGGARMELFSYKNGIPAATHGEKDPGLRHLAFWVDSVEGVEKRLREKGITMVLSTTDLPSLGARVLLFLDPDGVTLELCEKLKA
jgi:catechol 2,3-dioxygenase-like lactoylglutathione lyase family enzyme